MTDHNGHIAPDTSQAGDRVRDLSATTLHKKVKIEWIQRIHEELNCFRNAGTSS